MPLSRKHCLLVFTLFLLSVVIRLPTLNRPLAKHHEFCTAVSLRIMQIWHQEGIASSRFNPVMTYPNPADRFINNYASGSGKMIDPAGNYYYVSHPPLAYYLPFAVFSMLGIPPDVLPIESFNLVVHLLCGIGIFLILQTLMPFQNNLPALSGYTAYMFSPGTLWFHSNIYMADILVQFFFICGVYVALKWSAEHNRRWTVLLGVSTFLMTYTSWLGVFFCLVIMGVCIRQRSLKQAMVLAACPAAALLLTAFQYSRIAGWDALGQEWLTRFLERSGGSSWNIFPAITIITKNYLTSYLPLIIATGVLLIFYFRRISGASSIFVRFFLFSAVPVILLHVVLPDYSGHDFTTLYGGLFLAVFFGMLLSFAAQKSRRAWMAAVITLVVSFSIVQYYYINPPGEYSRKGDRYADFHDIGKSIATLSAADEVVFLEGIKASAEIVFYAGRNIRQIHDEREAADFLRTHPIAQGVIFRVTNGNKVMVANRISAAF